MKGDLLYPTIESSAHQALSPYLDELVMRQIIPRETAVIFNRLPDAALQKEAVARYHSKHVLMAWEIVRSLQNPVDLWAKRIPSPRRTAMAAGALIILLIGLSLKRVNIPVAPPVTALPPVVTPDVRWTPTPAPPKRPHRARHSDSPARKAESSEVPVPAHLEVHSISRKQALITWSHLGKGYTYTIYTADEAAMAEARKVQDRLPNNSYTLSKQTLGGGNAWLAVTATNSRGRESALSGTLHVKL